MTEKDDVALVMQVLGMLEARQTPRTIHSQTGIPKLVIERVRKLQLRAPTLLIATAAGQLCITEAFHLLKQREAQHARD